MKDARPRLLFAQRREKKVGPAALPADHPPLNREPMLARNTRSVSDGITGPTSRKKVTVSSQVSHGELGQRRIAHESLNLGSRPYVIIRASGEHGGGRSPFRTGEDGGGFVESSPPVRRAR